MRLRKAVLNMNGVLLLKEGETLTAKHLTVLKTWGVHEVDVCQEDGGEGDIASAVSPAILRRVEQETARRFRHAAVGSNPIMAMIARAAGRRLVVRLQAQAGPAESPAKMEGR
jgi:hypothetical protein